MRGHVDDFAPMTLSNHLPRRRLHGKQRACHIDRIEPLVAFSVDIDGFGCVKERCIVQKYVDFARLGHDLGQRHINA